MPRIVFHLSDGTAQDVDVEVGDTVMRGAVAQNLPGIAAECGGALTCATCHVHVPEAWYGSFPAPDLSEADLLEIVDDYTRQSRLSCQLTMTAALDGVDIFIPATP